MVKKGNYDNRFGIVIGIKFCVVYQYVNLITFNIKSLNHIWYSICVIDSLELLLLLKTYGAYSHVQHSRIRKQEKFVWVLSFNHLLIPIDTAFRYSYVILVFQHFLDKIK